MIPSIEVVGKAGGAENCRIEAIGVNVGAIRGVIVTLSVTVESQPATEVSKAV